MALSERVNILGKQLEDKKKERERHQREKMVMETETGAKEKEIRECREKEEEGKKTA